jgi:hypothetical protein
MIVSLFLFLFAVLSCAANSARVENSPNENGSYIDQPMPGVDPSLFSELRHRSVPLVDVNSIPSAQCAFGSNCLYPTPDAIPTCDLVVVPCPADAPSYEDPCHSYKLDCFCNAPRSLTCAWDCGWSDWMGVEDWCESLLLFRSISNPSLEFRRPIS